VLFNSYYNGIGKQFARARRGLLSRPLVSEVLAYREHVDKAMTQLLSDSSHPQYTTVVERCVLGLEHEMQHQELFFTDLKYSLGENPLAPAYLTADQPVVTTGEVPLRWIEGSSGIIEIGHSSDSFCFDNELPRHKTYLQPFEMANRLVTNGEYQQFIDDGGYRRPELWLADGWSDLQLNQKQQPHYWLDRDGEALEFTLHGMRRRDPRQPVCHINGYEADAYARWAGARLPTEMEWESLAAGLPITGGGVDDGIFHPQAANGSGLLQLYGACWQWTQSAYSPYPGFSSAEGAIGEYNGKFMSNQWVLRGGSCVTRQQHLRHTYRNFFYPQDCWQFSGIRLAR
jgi:ergothioneine biosynthesis protein EgtB